MNRIRRTSTPSEKVQKSELKGPPAKPQKSAAPAVASDDDWWLGKWDSRGVPPEAAEASSPPPGKPPKGR